MTTWLLLIPAFSFLCPHALPFVSNTVRAVNPPLLTLTFQSLPVASPMPSTTLHDPLLRTARAFLLAVIAEFVLNTSASARLALAAVI